MKLPALEVVAEEIEGEINFAKEEKENFFSPLLLNPGFLPERNLGYLVQ